MLTIFGWWKKVRPIGKKFFRICQNPENDLLEVIKSQKDATYEKCELDRHSLMKILQVIATMMSAGKMDLAANFCRMVAEKCFGQTPDNPYRLVFLSIALIAECEAKFYDMSFFNICSFREQPLKIRYSLCQQSSSGFLEMEPTIFKLADMLTMCEEFSHFACFRQCHVNLFKNLAEIDPDENLDWFDRLKVLDSNILALINESDLAFRLYDNEKDRKKFYEDFKNTGQDRKARNIASQYCFSWFNHLHFREICVRGTAAIEVLKAEQTFTNFVRGLVEPTKTNSKKVRRRLQPRNPLAEEEEKAKRISFGDDSGVLADCNVQLLRKQSTEKQRLRKRLVAPENIFITDVEDVSYSAPFADGKTFSNLNTDRIKNLAYYRKQRERHYDGGGRFSMDPRRRMPSGIRRKIRMIARKIMSEAREMQCLPMVEDEYLNKAFPVSDDECSDNEAAPKTFHRTETLESLKKKESRKFASLNPASGVRKVLWWQNAKDELMTTRAIANHCVKITGESSEPFCDYEKYMGKMENGEKSRDRISESRREANCRAFDLEKETNLNDGALLTMPAVSPFTDLSRRRILNQKNGYNSLMLQNMRRRCVDELLILMMIIKGQQQLQDGNVIRCVAYLMLIEFKFAVIAENQSKSHLNRNNNFDPYLMLVYKHFLAKFRLYSTDVFGSSSLNASEDLLLQAENTKFDLNQKCFDFCRNTEAYFFCICIKGRMVPMKLALPNSNFTLDREEVEKQHEFFFGLDNVSKNTHLNSFWRTECMPIISGLVHITHHSYLNKVDAMPPFEVEQFLNDITQISPETRDWLKLVTKNGFLVQRPKGVDPVDQSKCMVPMLFQLPSRTDATMRTENMVDLKSLEPVYKATTAFVREKNEKWKDACKADKEKCRWTNRDSEYRPEHDMTFYGEAIEKDVYMVAVYKGQKSSNQSQRINTGMLSLCREIRSQSGFLSIKNMTSKK